MRFIVYGVGAVGGVVAAALVRAGYEVLGIARGARVEALRRAGLTVRTPHERFTVQIRCVASPAEIVFTPDDIVCLVVKSQDTDPSLHALRAAGVREQPIVCMQNGVANERTAQRYFPNVHGATVMLPAVYHSDAEVAAFCVPNHGVLEIGRFPQGFDEVDNDVADALTRSRIAGFVSGEVMSSKYGKLIVNLGNAVEALLGTDTEAKHLVAALQAEGRRALEAAGIVWRDVGPSDPRRKLMEVRPVPGVERISSSTQSLARSAGSIETDYLNGEVVLIGRLHGVPTPKNETIARLAARAARDGFSPGSLSVDDLARMVDL